VFLARLLPLLALAAPAVAADAPTPPGQRGAGVATLSADAEARWIAFDLTPGNQIRFAMSVDGRDVTAILDTGVSYSVLSRAFAEAAKLRVLPGGVASAIGGAVDLGWVDTQRITLGGLTQTGGGLTVATLPALATGSAVPVDLLVGRDLTARYALDIDYAARRFRLLRSGRMPFRGVRAPLAISPDRLVYVGEIMLGAARLRPMVVDTGDGSAVTVTAAGWRAGAQAVPVTSAISFGLAGPVTSALSVVPEVRSGALVARQVEVRVEPANGFSETIGVAGRIGSGFLQKYRVLLDPRAGHMVLSAGPTADLPPLRSTSGLLVGLDGTRLRILHVMRGGPAEADGWQDGDEICTVDGTPIQPDYATSPLAAWSAGTPGRSVALGLCNGPVRHLTLRRFY